MMVLFEPRQAIFLTAHAQPFRGARDLAFCLKVPLDSLLVWASSEGSGETARMRRLAWTFAARIGDKYQIRLTRSICHRFVISSRISPEQSSAVNVAIISKRRLIQLRLVTVSNKQKYNAISVQNAVIN